MGNSKPPRNANIDLIDSYARLRGTDVELVLQAVGFDVTSDAEGVLRRGKQRVLAPVSAVDEGRRLVVTVPRERLGDGIWALRVRSGEDRFRIGARLLVQGERPLVLLWGARGGESTLPVPHPRDGEQGRTRGQGKARAAAGAILSILPERAATAIRRGARSIESRDRT